MIPATDKEHSTEDIALMCAKTINTHVIYSNFNRINLLKNRIILSVNRKKEKQVICFFCKTEAFCLLKGGYMSKKKKFSAFSNTYNSFKGSFVETKEKYQESKKDLEGKSFKDLPKIAYAYMALMFAVIIGGFYLAWVVTH